MRRFERLPKTIQAAVKASLERELIVLEGKVVASAKLRWRHGSAGLAGRVASKVTVEHGFGLDGVIGFRKTRGFPYELAQEFGAKPKKGKALAIPVTAEARRSGGPRNMEGLFIPGAGREAVGKYSGRTVGVLAREAARGKIRVHWVLVKSIPPRLNFRKTVMNHIPAISTAIERGGKGGLGNA